jgi:hypothetical protein
MTDTGPRRIGLSIEVKPHAYDPIANPELFEGVLARRCVAFLIDVTIIVLPVLFAAIFIFIFGLVTFGLGWALYWLLSPAAVLWAIGSRLRRLPPPRWACGSWIWRCAHGTERLLIFSSVQRMRLSIG